MTDSSMTGKNFQHRTRTDTNKTTNLGTNYTAYISEK